ncbi:HsdM family class I SAM-dependent methyltransferase [Halohasta litorea]|uniref:Class I SAM-dependent DNA methyltransferase n=1 Tax=Halohasta litorea TaxID=869891 RepID=A0ABD6D8A3_9EURY|nr:N-6 DNA methylase [Halohasta litorea]
MHQPTTPETAITAAASHIYKHLTGGIGSDLDAAVEAWCEQQGLDRLDDPREIVARQAAFNTLLKSTLYEQYHRQGRLPELPADPRDAFERARAETDDPAFTEYVLDDVASVADATVLTDLLDARHELVAADEPSEAIGRLFESLTPQSARRKLGQFRTPPAIASLMAEWLIRDGTETVLDPGMGAGALAAAAYKRKQALVDRPPLADIHGVDLNELAVVMAATSLALLNNGEPHNLRVGDFLNADPDDLEPVNAVISNPPYSRHHELDPTYKERVNAQAETEVGGSVSALSPMYAYFYYHAAECLAPGGRLSFITPSEFLETGYGESLKQFLSSEFDIRALVLFDRDEAKFDEALTTSLVSFLEKPDGDDPSDLTRIIRVDADPSEAELLAAIDGDREGETDWGFINAVPQADLEPGEKWTGLFDPLEIETDDLVALSALATVTRGIATGQNDYFCLTQQAVDEWGIDERYCSKIIRNARSVPGYEYTAADWEADREAGREVWVLYHLTELDSEIANRLQTTEADETRPFDDESPAGEAELDGIVGYLRHGLSDEIAANDGYLASHRTPWYVVDRRDPPPVVVTYMSRGGSRFIRNETDARTLSNLHGLYFDVDLTDSEQRALLAYLNSEFASEVVRRSGRTYASGMDKIEPNELEGVPVLDPRGLDSETVDALAARFDDLRAAARENTEQSTEAAVAAIDELLVRIR